MSTDPDTLFLVDAARKCCVRADRAAVFWLFTVLMLCILGFSSQAAGLVPTMPSHGTVIFSLESSGSLDNSGLAWALMLLAVTTLLRIVERANQLSALRRRLEEKPPAMAAAVMLYPSILTARGTRIAAIYLILMLLPALIIFRQFGMSPSAAFLGVATLFVAGLALLIRIANIPGWRDAA